MDVRELRALLQELIDLHRDGLRLALRLMMLQSLADEMKRLAARTIHTATESPGDVGALDRVVSVVAAARTSTENEARASALWAEHLARTDKAISAAEKAIENL